MLVLVLVAVIVAGLLSFYASTSPDGLNRVAEDHEFSQLEQDHSADRSVFAGYETDGVADDRLSGGLAGVAGVGLTFALGAGIFLLVRRRAS